MRKYKHKIYYTAGLISLILLPILCVWKSKNHEAFKNCSSIDIQFWNGKEDNEGTKGITNFLNSKRFITVNLNGDNATDLRKIDIAAIEIKKIKLSKDSIKGVKFHFGPKSDYATFIRVLDVLAIQKPGCYIPYKDDIFVANPKIIKSNFAKVDISGLIRKCSSVSKPKDEKFIDLELLQDVLKKYYLLIILFFLMVFFQFKKIFRSNF